MFDLTPKRRRMRAGLMQFMTVATFAAFSASALAVNLYSNQSPNPNLPALDPQPMTWSGVAAPAGSCWSEVQHNEPDRSLSNTVAGYSVHEVAGGGGNFRLADDFTIPAGQRWRIDGVCVYVYKTAFVGIPVIPPVRLRIWNGAPNAGGVIVFDGNAGVPFAATDLINTPVGPKNLFRIFNTVAPPPGTAPGTTRRLYEIAMTVPGGLVLPAGTYWIDYQTTPNGGPNNFNPSTTHHGIRGVAGANGLQFQAAGWVATIDGGNPASAPDVPQDLPFIIKGENLQPELRIDDAQPRMAKEGEVVRIIGAGFGNNPDNICLVVMNGANAVPMEVLTANGTEMTAVLGPVDPQAMPGPMMVAIGQGDRGPFQPIFRDIIQEDPARGTWVWDRMDGPAAMGNFDFLPMPMPPPPRVQWYFGRVVDGALCLFIGPGKWMPNSYVQVHARLHNHAMRMGADLRAFCLRFRVGGSSFHCALRLCDVIRCAFARRGIQVNCQVTQAGRRIWKLTVTKKFQGQRVPIDWGNFNVCVFMPQKHRSFRRNHTGFGQAVINSNPTRVQVTNIGSSGQDGVSIDLRRLMLGGPETFIDTEMVALNLVSGNALTLQAWGSFNMMEDMRLGEAMLRRGQGFFDVFADFSDIGSPLTQVEVFNQGMFVGRTVVPNGQIGQLQIAEAPTGCGKLPPRPLPCYWWGWDGPFLLRTVDGMSFEGNELRLLAGQAQGQVDYLQMFDIRAQGLTEGALEINIVGENVPAPEILLPDSVNVDRGTLTGGDVFSLEFDDDDKLLIQRKAPFLASDPDARAVVDFTAPAASATVLRAMVVSSSNAVPAGSAPQIIEAFDWVANRFVELDRRAVTGTDTLVVVPLPPPVNRWIRQDGSNLMRLRGATFERGTLLAGWVKRYDQFVVEFTD